MQIHELPIGNIEDANKLPFDTGSNTYSVSFSSLATAVADKTFSGLNTANKTILTAINELYTTKTTGELLRVNTVGDATVNLNSITDGWHQIDTTNDIVNAPVTRKTAVVLQTSNTPGNGTKYQLYITANGMEMWQRTCWYGTWNAWGKIYGKTYEAVSSGSYGLSSVNFWRHGNEVTVQFSGSPSGLTVGWKQIASIPEGFIPSATTPYATLVPQDSGFQPFVVRATSAGTLDINPTYVEVTGHINALYTYYVD